MCGFGGVGVFDREYEFGGGAQCVVVRFYGCCVGVVGVVGYV